MGKYLIEVVLTGGTGYRLFPIINTPICTSCYLHMTGYRSQHGLSHSYKVQQSYDSLGQIFLLKEDSIEENLNIICLNDNIFDENGFFLNVRKVVSYAKEVKASIFYVYPKSRRLRSDRFLLSGEHYKAWRKSRCHLKITI